MAKAKDIERRARSLLREYAARELEHLVQACVATDRRPFDVDSAIEQDERIGRIRELLSDLATFNTETRHGSRRSEASH